MCLHVDVRRLEAALVDVVVCEGLRGVGAVLVHRDGHFAMSHPFRRLDMRRRSFTGIQQRAVRRSSFRATREAQRSLPAAAAGGGGRAGGAATQATDSTTTRCSKERDTHTAQQQEHTSNKKKKITFL